MFRLFVCSITIFAVLNAHANDLLCDGVFKGETVRMVVGHKAGGGYDLMARLFAAHYVKHTGAEMVVENWPAGHGLVGLRKVAESSPDGLTLGLLDAPKHVLAHELNQGEQDSIDIFSHFSILARISRSRHVLFVRAGLNIESFDDLYNAEPTPLFGTKNFTSTGFTVMQLISNLLDIKSETISGLGGTRKRVLAMARGEIDLILSNFYSVVTDVEEGILIPILQISNNPISDHSALAGVPVLAGPQGVAARHLEDSDTNNRDLLRDADSIQAYSSAGRLFVAPIGVSDSISACLQHIFLAILNDPAFIHDADKSSIHLDVVTGKQAEETLKSALAGLKSQIPALKHKLANN